MHISNTQKAIIIGTILGDGCLEKNGLYPRLRMEHADFHRSYLEWKIKQLGSFITPASPMKVDAYHSVQKKNYISWRAYTFSSPQLSGVWNMFYHNGKKKIPENIDVLLNDPLSLSVWFMDDGYKRNDCNAFRINTDSFGRDEVLLLSGVLRKNFGVQCALHKKGVYWNIYIPRVSAKKFADIIIPHIIPVMRYKIALAP